MREIKFRAFDKRAKKMLNVDTLYIDKKMFQPIGGDEYYVYGYDTKYYSDIMQYTGLKDKNGVEIYNGDIVKYTTCTKDKNIFFLEIEYEEELARFHIRGRYSKSSVIFSLTADSVLDAEIEVVGNIYENTELLKENK